MRGDVWDAVAEETKVKTMTYRCLVLAGIMSVTGAAAQACPDYSLSGATFYRTGADLWVPERLRVVAGGESNLDVCPLRQIGTRTGWTARRPDFTMHLSEASAYMIDFAVESRCDTVLLVNTGNGNWFYNDDALGRDAGITLNQPSEGWYDIWVGTFDGSMCDAILNIETFARNSRSF